MESFAAPAVESALGTVEILVMAGIMIMLFPRMIDANIWLIAEIIGRAPGIRGVTVTRISFTVAAVWPASAQAAREQAGRSDH
jgi:hypothetical protein